jgi:small-conductance mechanosensitive channel
LVIQLGLWTQAVLMGSLGVWTAKHAGVSNRTTLASGLGIAARFVLWSVVVLVALSNMGVRVDALVAGLGIGGVAAALAVQNLLGDIIASVSIFVDRPFDLGDFIVVEAYQGTVEHIGWRSTQLKSISGEQLVLPNSDLMRSRIRNYKRMSERRVELMMGLSYNTSVEEVQRAPELIREAISAVDGVRFDRAHFKGFGTTALEFVAVWFTEAGDYNVFMDRQQAVNLGILQRFRELGVVFTRPLEAVPEGSAQADAPSAETQ